MDDIFTYLTHLPRGIREMITPCENGYTIYLDESLDEQERLNAYTHAIGHIANSDYEKSDVQEIEARAHGIVAP